MLNKQGKGKIDWCDYTWNPVSGCLHGCEYCYMRRFARRYPKKELMKPRFHKNRLKDVDRLKEPSKIFVCSSGDLFGDWIPEEWIYEVLDVVKKHTEHTFQLLTKNPKRYIEFHFPRNCWIGATVDGTKKTINNFEILKQACNYRIKFISFEPLLRKVYFNLKYIDWIIIGANSNRGVVKPPKDWADTLIREARRVNTSVWVKDNYGYPERIKEFPK